MSRRIAPALGALFLYLLCALLLFHGAWSHPSTRLIGDGGDTAENVWWLAYFAHSLSHGSFPLVSDYMDYPSGFNLMWNTSFPLMGALLSPVTLLFGPVVAFNVLETLALALSAWTCSLLFRQLAGSWRGALVGGYVYGFSPFMLAQSLGHPQVTLGFLPPLLLLLAYRVLVLGRRPFLYGALAGLLAAGQLLIGEEVLAMTALFLLVVVIVAIAMRPAWLRRQLPPAARALGSSLAVFALLAAWPLYVQFRGPHRPGSSVHAVSYYRTDIQNFVFPTNVQLITPQWALQHSAHWFGNTSEYDAYLGVPLIALLAVAFFVLRREPLVRVASALAALLGMWSLGLTVRRWGVDTGLPSYAFAVVFLLAWPWLPVLVLLPLAVAGWWALANLPVFDNLLPPRLMDLAYLAIGLVIAFWVAWALRLSPRWRRLAALAAVALALLPLLPTAHFRSVPGTAPAFFNSRADLARIPQGSVVLSAPFGSNLDQAPLLWQATAGMRYRIPGGYAIIEGPPPYYRSFGPPDSALQSAVDDAASGSDPAADPSRRQELLDQLRAWRVSTVVVGEGDAAGSEVAFFSDLLGRPPDHVDGVYVWFDI